MPTQVRAIQLDAPVVTDVVLDERYLTFTDSGGNQVKIDMKFVDLKSVVEPAFATKDSSMTLTVEGGTPGATFTISEVFGTGLDGTPMATKQLDAQGRYLTTFNMGANYSLGLHDWQLQFSDGKSTRTQFITYQGLVITPPPAAIQDEVSILSNVGTNLYSSGQQKWITEIGANTTIQFKSLNSYGSVSVVNVSRTSGPDKVLYDQSYSVAVGATETSVRSIPIPNDASYVGDYNYSIVYKDASNNDLKTFNITVVVGQPAPVTPPTSSSVRLTPSELTVGRTSGMVVQFWAGANDTDNPATVLGTITTTSTAPTADTITTGNPLRPGVHNVELLPVGVVLEGTYFKYRYGYSMQFNGNIPAGVYTLTFEYEGQTDVSTITVT